MARIINLTDFAGSEAYQYNDSSLNYDDIFTIGTFYKYGIQSCRNVRWKSSTINYELDLLCITVDVLHRIIENKYRALPFNNFLLNERGKTRQISAQQIIDRGVQKVINKEVLLPIYTPNFIVGNSASMEGKGKRFTVELLLHQLREHFKKYGVEGGILVGDYKNFFGSLPHEEIKRRFVERIHNALAVKILKDAVTDFRNLPNMIKDSEWGYRTIGLGSEFSQTIALDYPNIIDHWIEDNFDLTGDGRYMDDFYASSGSMDELYRLREELFDKTSKAGLVLNPKKTIVIPFKSHRFSFLKLNFAIKENGKVLITPSKKSKKRTHTVLMKLRKELDEGKIDIDVVCQSYNGMRASLLEAKDSYRTVHGMDIYFINLFRNELRTHVRPFKCYIKCITTKNGYEYITKSIKGDKKHSIRQKQAIKKRNKERMKIETQYKEDMEFIINEWNSISQEDKEKAFKLLAKEKKAKEDARLVKEIEERDRQRVLERERRKEQSKRDKARATRMKLKQAEKEKMDKQIQEERKTEFDDIDEVLARLDEQYNLKAQGKNNRQMIKQRY